MFWPFVGRRDELRALQRGVATPLPYGVLIRGVRGVGKTRLLGEVVDWAVRSRWDVEQMRGLSPEVPFGAVAPLVGELPAGSAESLELLVRIRDDLVARHRGRRLLIAVDDVQNLDVGSALLVAQMAARGFAMVVGVARSEDPLPTAFASLVKDELLATVMLGRLSDADVESLIRRALDGPVDPVMVGRLGRLAAGNPLVLRELIADGIETGGLRVEGGVWRSAGGGLAARRVEQIVADRLGRLEAAEVQALELLAVVERLGTEALSGLCGHGLVASLLQKQLLSEQVEGRRSLITFDHPVLGEVLRSRMSPGLRRRYLLRLAEAVEVTGGRRTMDTVRVALWHLEAGEPEKAERLSEAAAIAVSGRDFVLAGRLAEAAVGAGGGVGPKLIQAVAMSKHGNVSGAEILYGEIGPLVEETPLWVPYVAQRAENLGIRGGDLEGAIRLIEGAIAGDIGPVERASLRAQLGFLYAWLPRLDHAGVIAAQILDDPEAPMEARAAAFSIASVVDYWRGAFADLYRLDGQFAETVRPALPPRAETIDRMDIDRLISYMYDGRVTEAIGPLRAGYEGAVSPPIDDYAPIWAIHVAMALSITGQVRDAIRVSEDALSLEDRIDPTGIKGVGISLHAVYSGRAGDRTNLAHALSRIEQPQRFVGPADAWVHMARAWGYAIEGDLTTAAELSARAGGEALDCEFLVLAAWAFRQAVTFEHPELAVDGLEAIADAATASTLDTFARHARALGERDAPGVEAAAAQHAGHGEYLFAVNAYRQAAALHRRQQHAHLAMRAATTAQQIAIAHTQIDPATVCADLPVLTPRELEVATLAAHGQSSRDIADRLHLSVRTVDNHLASVYTKLDIHHRDELTHILRPA